MKFKPFLSSKMENLSYLLYDDYGSAAVIDPSWESIEILKEAEKLGLNIKAVLLTHGHYDHTEGLDIFERQEIKTYIGREDIFLLGKELKKPVYLKDSEKLKIINEEIICLHTPGHSPGSYCFLCNGELFTGDTLFPGCCGRVDLPGSDPAAMRNSLLKISALDPSTRIHSGHSYNGGESTIEKEIKTNPCLINISDEDGFFNAIL